MTADEDIEELVIEPIRIVHDLLDLQPRLNIEIVADVTSLKIEIDDADSTLTRGLVGLELHGRLERKRRVANAAGARDERNRDWLGATCIAGMLCIPASALPRKDIKDLFRIGVNRDPISIAAAQKRLVIARRKLIADQNKKDAAAMVRRHIHDFGEMGHVPGRRYNEHKSRVFDGAAGNDVGNVLDIGDSGKLRDGAPNPLLDESGSRHLGTGA